MANLGDTHIKEFGFFFFLRMAVAVSFSYIDMSVAAALNRWRSLIIHACAQHQKHH
jgi:hypothetical protein